MNFEQRNFKLFHQYLRMQRVLMLVILNRLAKLFRLTQIQAPSPIPLNIRGKGVVFQTISRI